MAMLTHPCAEQHPLTLDDCPTELLDAWSADCLPQHDGDPFAIVDGLTLINAIPRPRRADA